VKIQTKFILSSIVAVVLIISPLGVGGPLLWQVREDADAARQRSTEMIHNIQELQVILQQATGELYASNFRLLNFFLAKRFGNQPPAPQDTEIANITEYLRAIQTYEERLNAISQLAPSASELENLRAMNVALQDSARRLRFIGDIASGQIEGAFSDDALAEAFRENIETVKPLEEQIEVDMVAWVDRVEQQRGLAMQRVQRVEDTIEASLWAIIGIILSVSASQFGTIIRPIIRSIQKLQLGAAEIGAGNLRYRLDIRTRDEIGQLSSEFNQMAEKLVDSYGSLEQAKETAETLSVALKNELEKGWQLQQDFLPLSLPQPPGWELGALLHPARDVSGDFYDAFTTSRGLVALVIGDVCDKGVGSAFFMALSRSLIRIFCAQTERQQADLSVHVNPLNAVRFANDYIIQHHSGTNIFTTLFFAILDPDTGLLSYINAGHEPPTILGPAGVKARLSPNGPAVGVIPGIDFDIGQVCLEAGDILIAYTDGVTEARNLDGKFFTEKQLLALMEQSAPSAVALLDRLEGSVRAHMGNAVQFDDITMLAIRRVSISESSIQAERGAGYGSQGVLANHPKRGEQRDIQQGGRSDSH
jgi:serine phosphatase RsbU (regulator of sigma subunit)